MSRGRGENAVGEGQAEEILYGRTAVREAVPVEHPDLKGAYLDLYQQDIRKVTAGYSIYDWGFEMEDLSAVDVDEKEVEIAPDTEKKLLKTLEAVIEEKAETGEDGGGGRVTIDVVNEKTEFDHYDHFMNSSSEPWEVDMVEDARERWLPEGETPDPELEPTVLYKKLASAGVAEVVMSYNGYGDSGQLESTDLLDKEGKSVKYDKDPALKEVVEQVEADTFTEIEGGAPGWEINEGSNGTVTIDVATRKAHFDHYNNFEDEEAKPFSMGPLDYIN